MYEFIKIISPLLGIIGIIGTVVNCFRAAKYTEGTPQEKKAFTRGIIFMSIMLLGFWGFICESNSYKQGQIDALTGKIQYQLKTNPDSTKYWIKIGK